MEQCLGSRRQSLGGPQDVGNLAIAAGRGVLRLGSLKAIRLGRIGLHPSRAKGATSLDRLMPVASNRRLTLFIMNGGNK